MQDIAIDESLMKLYRRVSFIHFNPTKRAHAAENTIRFVNLALDIVQFRIHSGKKFADQA
jgi:hypothetical protein